MTVSTSAAMDAAARSIALGNAPATQNGAGGQWATAWSRAGVTAQQKADLTSLTESWSATKYTDALSSTLAGGDVFAGDLGVSGQSAATTAVKQEIDGKEGLRFVLAEPASGVAIGFSSFFAGDDGTGYAEAARVRFFDANGALVGESFVQATSTSGNQLVQLSSSIPFSSVELSAGALRADGSFSYGGYLKSDGSFGSDIYADAGNAKHGSDFLLDAIAFQIARPLARADAFALDEDAGLVQLSSVLGNDSAPGAASLTAVLEKGPAHGALTLNADGSFSYKADADFEGADTFTYRAYNGKDYSEAATVQLNVAAVNDAPTAVADNAATAEDTAVRIDVLANDSAGPANESAQHLAVTAAHAAHGTVSIDADGRLLYVPEANYYGTDQIDYTVSDNGMTRGAAAPLSAAGQVQVVVSSVNDLPVARNDVAATDEDSTVSGNLLSGTNGGADTDVDGDVLTVTTVGSFVTEQGATVTISQNGDFLYDPRKAPTLQALAAGTTLADGFTYAVSDGHGGSATAHVQVNVGGKAEAAAKPVTGAQVGPDVALKYYLSYTSGVTKWVEVDGLQLDFDQTGNTTLPGGGGAAAGKATVSDLATSLGSSEAVVELTQALLKGNHLTGVNIEAYRTGADGKPQLVQEYGFGEVRIDSMHTVGQDGSTGNSLTFSFNGMTQVTPYGDSAGQTDPERVMWSFAENTAGSGGPTGGQAPIGKLPASDTALDYYVRLDPKGAWLLLSDFNMGFDVVAGRASSDGVSMSLGSTPALADMLTALLKGIHLDSVEVEAYAHGSATPRLVDEYVFKNVIVTDLDTSNVTSNMLGLSFTQFTHGHQNYDAAGNVRTPSGVGFDLAANAPVVAPAPVATAAVGGKITTGAQLGPDAALKYYLSYTSGGTKWVQVDGLQLNFDNSGTAVMGNAGGAGKVTVSDLVTSLGSSDAVVELTQALLKGNHLPGVNIEAYRTGADGKPQLVQEYGFGEVRIDSMHTVGQDGSTGNSLTFSFNGLTQVTPYVDSAGQTDPARVLWSFADNTAGSGGPTGGQAPIGKLPASDTALDYYVRLDPKGDWLLLSGFNMGFDVAANRASSDGVSMSLGSTPALADMLTGLLKGLHLDSVEVEAYAHGSAAPRLVDEYVFKNVIVTDLDTSNVSSNTLGLSFAQFTRGHQNYDAAGNATTSTGVGFDLGANAPIVAPAPVATAAVGGKITTGAQVGPDAALKYYLSYTSGGTKWVEVDGLQLNFDNSATAVVGSGAGAGKATVSDLATSLGSSDAVVELTQALLKGNHLPGANIEAYRTGADGKPVLVQEYGFGEVRIDSMHTVAQDGSTGNSLSFSFNGLTQVTPYGDSAGRVDPERVLWSFGASAGESGGPTGGQAPIGKLPASDTALDYYVRLDPKGDWLLLSGFNTGLDVVAGKASSDGVSMSLGSTPALADMLTGLLKGLHLDAVEVEAYAHGSAAPRLVDEYVFKNIIVTDLDTSNVSSNTLGLSFAQFTHGHQNYDAAGNATTSTGVGFDLAANVQIVAPIPHADLPFA